MDTKILLVARDRELVAAVRCALASVANGYQVLVAPSGHSALLQFGITQPDLMVLDVNVPSGDGWETLGRIRQLSNLPVIAIVAAGEDMKGLQCLEVGADVWLPRPLPVRELRARVRALLRRDRLRSGTQAALTLA